MGIGGRILRPSAATLALGLVAWLALCGLASRVWAAEADAPEPASRRWHRQLERLDRELAHEWGRVWRERARKGLAERVGRGGSPDRSRALAELRTRLDLLELRVHGLPEEEGSPWRAKVRSLGRRLANLELAWKGAGPLPEDRLTSVGSGATVGPVAAPAVSGSNFCSAAPIIGNGTFTGTTVGATNDGTAFCGTSSFSPDVWFRYVAPASGPVSMDTFGSGYDTVLSVHSGCPGEGFTRWCSDDAFGLQSAIAFTAQAGVSYWVRVSGFDGATGPFVLHVGPGGALSGRVTEAASGTPVTAGEVSLRDANGFTLQSAPLEPDGSYTLGGLEAGTYRLRTDNEQGLRDEVWDDHPCTGGLLCDLGIADLVGVESLDTTTGIDFALEPGAEITGTVRRAANGDPAPGVRVEAWTHPGLEAAAATISGADGSYALTGLAAGSYLVFAESPEFTDVLYDGVTCPGGFLFGFSPGCDRADGTVVTAILGTPTTGIDFALERLGLLTGTVTQAGTGLPLEGVRVTAVADRGGSATALTAAAGAYRIGGLSADTYYLRAEDLDHLPEAYDEIPCDSCDLRATGTPVPLALGQLVGGLDFTLEPYGSLSGNLTDAVTGEPVIPPLPFRAEVQVFDGQGLLEEEGFVDSSGQYRVFRLPAGQYFVKTDVFGTPYLDELHDDQPCYEGCDVTGGTPVTVLPGTETPDVDFALDRGGTINGVITDAITGGSVSSDVRVYDLVGNLVPSLFEGFFGGGYTISKLVPGSYLFVAEPFSSLYVDQLYDRVPCLRGLFISCQPVQGTPVEVTLNTTVSGIDFPLVPTGSISGRVTDAVTGGPVESGRVHVVDLRGEVSNLDTIRVGGVYTVDRLPPGEYLVRTVTGNTFPPEYMDEVYDDQTCEVECTFDRQLALGTPVTVTAGTDTPGIDFGLSRKRAIAGRVFDAGTGQGISGALVVVLAGDGQTEDSTRTSFDGTYQTDPLTPGTYTVFTFEVTGFLDELYDDILCSGLACRSTKGTPVQVTPLADTTGIDFALEPLSTGLIGTVLDDTTGQPMAGVAVQVWDAAGNPVVRRTTRANGVWFVGLPPGTYYASTDAGSVFPDQVYRDVFCNDVCDPLAGTPLVLSTGIVIRGVDFRLRPPATEPAADDCAGAPGIGHGLFTGTTVGATNDGTASCGLSDFTADVWFRYDALVSGKVSVDTFGSAFDTVLSVYTGCPGAGAELSCSDDVEGLQSALAFTAEAGASYWVRVSGTNGATGDFDLRVGPGGSITGRVTAAVTGDPITAGEVVVSSPLGFTVTTAPLAGDGSYSVSGLTAFGSYLLHTENQQGARDEVWDDHPCVSGSLCPTLAGDSVLVNSLDTVAGIDFVLDAGGAIAGTVRQTATGGPAEGVRLEIWSLDRTPGEPRMAATTTSAADGSYVVPGLDGGSYLVAAVSSTWIDELYDDAVCDGPLRPRDCDLGTASPVTVLLGETASGIDFDLRRQGILEGTVTNSVTGEPIAGVSILLESENGNNFGRTDASGVWRVDHLRPGTYFLKAQETGFVTEVYQEVECHGFCAQKEVGTPVPVALDQIVTGLDFTLEPLGSISGTLVDAVSGDPVAGAEVRAFAPDGTVLGLDFSDSSGAYQMSAPSGIHVVRAEPSSGPAFLTELYDDIPCFAGCDLAAGTPVTVLPGTDTPGIDFALDRGGTISGTVTDSVTGAPLATSRVLVYDENGGVEGAQDASGTGAYAMGNLLPGTYFVVARASFYEEQLYDGVPCFGGVRIGCEIVQGTPVSVTANSIVSGVDLALDPLGSISGQITDAVSGEVIATGTVEIVDDRRFRATGFVGANGRFTVSGIPPRNVYVRTLLSAGAGFVNELFDDLPCDPSCDATAGTPVTVTPGAETGDVDFQLERRTAISGRVHSATTGEPITGASIEILDGVGGFRGNAVTDGDGQYRSTPLAPGTYFLRAQAPSYLFELYDDVPCPAFNCIASKGKPVTVTLAGDTTGIDFELHQFTAGLIGTVLDQTTARPVAGVEVRIWSSAGSLVQAVTTRRDGIWLADLPPGAYFVSTNTGAGFFDQVYSGVECGTSCNPLSGTPVTVATSSTIVRGIDFILEKTPAIFTDGFESGDVSAWTRRVSGPP